MKKSILQKYSSQVDENNNYSEENGVVLSSTVSEGFLGLHLLNDGYTDDSDNGTLPIEDNSFDSESDNDILSIDTDYEDDDLLIEAKVTPVGSFNKRKNGDDESHPLVKKRKVEATVEKTSSQPLITQQKNVALIEYSYSQNGHIHSSCDNYSKFLFARLFQKKEGIFSFKEICANFLIDQCNNANCRKLHHLPSPMEFKKRLSSLSTDDIKSMFFDVVLPYKELLTKYFCVFCELFAERSLKTVLIRLIRECDAMHMHSYYYHIIDALLKMGLKYSEALVIILFHHKNRTPKASLVLFDLISNRRNQDVTKFLNDLMELMETFKFNTVSVEKLITLSMERPNNKKLHKIALKALRESNITQVDDKILLKFTKKTSVATARKFK